MTRQTFQPFSKGLSCLRERWRERVEERERKREGRERRVNEMEKELKRKRQRGRERDKEREWKRGRERDGEKEWNDYSSIEIKTKKTEFLHQCQTDTCLSKPYVAHRLRSNTTPSWARSALSCSPSMTTSSPSIDSIGKTR